MQFLSWHLTSDSTWDRVTVQLATVKHDPVGKHLEPNMIVLGVISGVGSRSMGVVVSRKNVVELMAFERLLCKKPKFSLLSLVMLTRPRSEQSKAK